MYKTSFQPFQVDTLREGAFQVWGWPHLHLKEGLERNNAEVKEFLQKLSHNGYVVSIYDNEDRGNRDPSKLPTFDFDGDQAQHPNSAAASLKQFIPFVQEGAAIILCCNTSNGVVWKHLLFETGEVREVEEANRYGYPLLDRGSDENFACPFCAEVAELLPLPEDVAASGDWEVVGEAEA